MPFPTPSFTPWIPWSALFAANRKEALASALSRVGCYLLARFDGDVPSEEARPDDEHVFYIGEAHGNASSLAQRLTQFGTSAGFFGEQSRGHYAAWGYPRWFPADVIGGREGHRICTPDRVFVALCPWPTELPRATRGVFPGLVEAMAIWMHVQARKDLPRLNNRGRVRPPYIPEPPAFTDAELDRVLDASLPEGERIHAASMLLDHIATTAEYQRVPAAHPHRSGTWLGSERKAGTHYFYVGWYGPDPAAVTVSCYRGEVPIFGEQGGSVRTRDELKRRLIDLWITWWGGDPGEDPA